jgi:hypothetical protein
MGKCKNLNQGYKGSKSTLLINKTIRLSQPSFTCSNGKMGFSIYPTHSSTVNCVPSIFNLHQTKNLKKLEIVAYIYAVNKEGHEQNTIINSYLLE